MRSPVFFIGHGSPMNALASNPYAETLRGIRARFGEPEAVLVISAHWMTEGSWATHMARPRTIHDFYGFPAELSEVQYPAPGSPPLAERLRDTVRSPPIQLDDGSWGLDHGAWSVLRHIFPEARIPVVQLSLDIAQPSMHHFELGRALRPLRDEGVWIVGSGNLVHNLRRISRDENAPAFPWAVEFDAWCRDRILARDEKSLTEGYLATDSGRLSVPTQEHYLPFLYALGAATGQDEPGFLFEGIQNGSISMRSVVFSSR